MNSVSKKEITSKHVKSIDKWLDSLSQEEREIVDMVNVQAGEQKKRVEELMMKLKDDQVKLEVAITAAKNKNLRLEIVLRKFGYKGEIPGLKKD